jgi:hypothetical protein
MGLGSPSAAQGSAHPSGALFAVSRKIGPMSRAKHSSTFVLTAIALMLASGFGVLGQSSEGCSRGNSNQAGRSSPKRFRLAFLAATGVATDKDGPVKHD